MAKKGQGKPTDPINMERLRALTDVPRAEIIAQIRYTQKPVVPESYEHFISAACKGRMSSRPAFYSGRGVMRGDLGPEHLKMIHAGLLEYFGEAAGWQFVRLVAEATDMSATAFLLQFQRFWMTGLVYTGQQQERGDQFSLDGIGHSDAEKYATGMAIIGAALGQNKGDEYNTAETESIKREFLASVGVVMPFGRSGYEWMYREDY